MSKKLKHKLVNLFLQLYTRRRDFSHSVAAFKQLETIAGILLFIRQRHSGIF